MNPIDDYIQRAEKTLNNAVHAMDIAVHSKLSRDGTIKEMLLVKKEKLERAMVLIHDALQIGE